MGTAEDSAAIRSLLAETGGHKSDTARLGDVLPDIEAVLAAGVSRRTLFSKLKGLGFRFTFNGFAMALYRLRQKRDTAPPNTPTSKAATSPQPTKTPKSPAVVPKGAKLPKNKRTP